jgi:hypothetical protein
MDLAGKCLPLLSDFEDIDHTLVYKSRKDVEVGKQTNL